MAAGDLVLNILLKATDGASPVIGQVQQSLGGFAGAGGVLGAVVGAGVAAATALVGVGVASTKAAADFQQSMNQVQALAGVSAKDAQAASDAIMKMSTDLGQSPKTLADGLYYIASAGYSAKDSLQLLALSTKAASVGNTDTTTTANALTAAMKAFGVPASGAAKIMDEMVKTVSTGKTEFADYANVIGKISLNAKQAKVSFEEANAAFAILTNVMPSSKQAADSLNALLQTSSRIDLLTSRAKALGLQFNANAYQSMNFEQRLQYLLKITHGNQEEMTKLLGRQNAVAAATALATGNFGDYNDALNNIKNSSGALDQAWEKTSSGFNVQMGRLKASVDVLLISIGNQLLPFLSDIVKAIAPVISKFAQWVTSSGIVSKAIDSLKTGLHAIGTFLSPVVNWFSGLFTQAGKAGQAMGGLSGIFSALQPILKQIGDFLVATFKPVWDELVQTWQSQVVPAWNDLMKALEPAMPSLKLIGQLLLGLIVVSLIVFIKGLALVLQGLIPIFAGIIVWTIKFVQGVLWIVAQCQPAIQAIVNAFQWLYDKLVGHSIIPDLINGIIGWFTKLPAFFTGLMQGIISFLAQQWNTVLSNSKKILQDLYNAFVSGWNNVVNAVKNAWKTISTVVSTAWQTYVVGPLNQFFNNLKNWFTTNVVNQFGTWATNAMKMFAQNITAGITNVTTAVTGVANTIKKLLGFASPPQSGPLATSHMWMPNMMRMFAQGITTNTPVVTTATNNLALKIKTQFATLDTTINTSTNNINNKMNLLSTNVTNQSTQISTQFATLDTNVQNSTTNIGNKVQLLNTNVNTNFQQIGTGAQQTGVVVSSSSVQMSESVTQAASNVAQSASHTNVIIGNTSHYVSQTVTEVDQNTKTIEKNMEQMKGHNEKITQDMYKIIHDVLEGDGIRAAQHFMDAVVQFGQAAVNQARADAAAIANLLGHSKPKEGPLRDDDQWGKHMIQNIVGGMQDEMPALMGATDAIASHLASVGIGSRTALSVNGRLSSATPSNNQPMVIQVNLDKKVLGKVITHYQQKELHVQGGVRGK